ncbi:BAG family molecular chaperone regulator 1-like [Prosopis cineraria]|uniref:BAG family molecular chaperone regulator 1-like n=1 Tax=Prosopis cineraria TaxID=364024 RepID=UPI00240FB5EA|nr:BAG family molecular chaperone regulator 1-like [Prosopis cineraria]XP_054797008.1 BAG family molecular chaperone regulator 1-like [Prosopis cineraria]
MMKMNGISGEPPAAAEWEMRPGGMLVQKRSAEADRNSVPAPTIRVRVKYGSTYHQVNISSQATFGELKKMLSGPTGLHHQDQKLLYKNKERDSKTFLDIVGVKDKSKIVLEEDPISKEKRYLEMRKNANMEKAAKCISQISLEVDRLAGQVGALESIISKGKKVAESDVISLIEQFMNQLLKLDAIMADGDVKLQRKMQVRRVQKYVETLDMLKIKNSMPHKNAGHKHNTQQKQSLAPIVEEQPQRYSNAGGVVVTTNWETFDSAPSPLILATSPPASTSATRTTTTNSNSVLPRFNWELFN